MVVMVWLCRWSQAANEPGQMTRIAFWCFDMFCGTLYCQVLHDFPTVSNHSLTQVDSDPEEFWNALAGKLDGSAKEMDKVPLFSQFHRIPNVIKLFSWSSCRVYTTDVQTCRNMFNHVESWNDWAKGFPMGNVWFWMVLECSSMFCMPLSCYRLLKTREKLEKASFMISFQRRPGQMASMHFACGFVVIFSCFFFQSFCIILHHFHVCYCLLKVSKCI